MELHPDFRDLLAEFAVEKVEFMVIGGYAVGYYDRPRYTLDIDLWIGPSPENIAAAARALEAFGAPDHVVSAFVHARDDEIVWLGTPPLRRPDCSQTSGWTRTRPSRREEPRESESLALASWIPAEPGQGCDGMAKPRCASLPSPPHHHRRLSPLIPALHHQPPHRNPKRQRCHCEGNRRRLERPGLLWLRRKNRLPKRAWRA